MENNEIFELLERADEVLDAYKTTPSVTSKSHLKFAQIGNLMAIEQNTAKDSIYSDLAKSGIEVVQLLLNEPYKKPTYFGVKIGKYMYLYFTAIKRLGINPQTIYEYTATLNVKYSNVESTKYDMHTYEVDKRPVMIIIQNKVHHSSTILLEVNTLLNILRGDLHG
mgnify:CR=1 FL=1